MPTHTSTLFSIATGSSEPIYRQLIEQVRRLTAAGQLQPGDDMPSVREIAQALALNPMTVSKAYGLLEMEGVLARRRGLGMVVAERAAPAEPAATAPNCCGRCWNGPPSKRASSNSTPTPS
jgi:GntR family transcriptional regulator